MKVERILCFPRDCPGRDSSVAPEFRPVSRYLLPLPWIGSGEKSFSTSPEGLWREERQKYSVGYLSRPVKTQGMMMMWGYICLDVATLEDMVRPNSKCLVFLIFLSGHLHRVSPGLHQQTRRVTVNILTAHLAGQAQCLRKPRAA